MMKICKLMCLEARKLKKKLLMDLDLLCLYTCFRKQSNCTIILSPLFMEPNEWHSRNQHLFSILFSLLCSVCGLIPYLLHSTNTALKKELLTSPWPFLQGSELQFFTNVNVLSQHLEMRFYYYFNFTVGYKQLDGGPKYSLILGVQEKTVILQKYQCAAITAPPTRVSSKR